MLFVTTCYGEFLETFTCIGETSSGVEGRTPMDHVAHKIVDVWKKYNMMDSIMATGGDTCTPNTGVDAGAFVLVEKILGWRLLDVECLLHLNELPLRKVVQEKIGETSSKTTLKVKFN